MLYKDQELQRPELGRLYIAFLLVDGVIGLRPIRILIRAEGVYLCTLYVVCVVY